MHSDLSIGCSNSLYYRALAEERAALLGNVYLRTDNPDLPTFCFEPLVNPVLSRAAVPRNSIFEWSYGHRPLVDTPSVSGGAYKFRSVDLPAMVNLYRIDRTLFSDHIDSNVSYSFNKKLCYTAKALDTAISGGSKFGSLPPTPTLVSRILPRDKRHENLPNDLT
jgi:hypothetical protein